jgi:hypothetical protein
MFHFETVTEKPSHTVHGDYIAASGAIGLTFCGFPACQFFLACCVRTLSMVLKFKRSVSVSLLNHRLSLLPDSLHRT